MLIQELLQQVENAKNPVAKALHKGDHHKVLAIAFKKDMILKEHQTHLPAMLLVLAGKVVYNEAHREVVALQYEEIAIPVETMHQVTALEDSLCLLIQG